MQVLHSPGTRCLIDDHGQERDERAGCGERLLVSLVLTSPSYCSR